MYILTYFMHSVVLAGHETYVSVFIYISKLSCVSDWKFKLHLKIIESLNQNKSYSFQTKMLKKIELDVYNKMQQKAKIFVRCLEKISSIFPSQPDYIFI